jgi:large subunit ribosomal protein L23
MSTAPEKAKASKTAKAPKAEKAVKAEAKAKQPAAKKAKAAAAEGDAAARPAKVPKTKKTAEKKAKAAAPVIPQRSAHAESRLAQILVAPIVSEKATMAAEKHNQVLFKVLRDATKPEIKAAVELMFKVSVDSVQTVQHKGKAKRFGKSTGRRDHVKKAYVCLAEGQELNFSGEAA